MKLLCIGGPIDGYEMEFKNDENHIDLYRPDSLVKDVNGWKPTSAPISTYVIHTFLGEPVFAAHKSIDGLTAMKMIVARCQRNGRS